MSRATSMQPSTRTHPSLGNLHLLRSKVTQIIESNESEQHLPNSWQKLSAQSPTQTSELMSQAADDLCLKREQLLTIGRLFLQTIRIVEEEIDDRTEENPLKVIEALRIGMAEKDSVIQETGKEIQRLNAKIQRIEADLGKAIRENVMGCQAEKGDKQGNSVETNAQNLSEIALLKSKLDNLETALRFKQNQLSQKQGINSKLVRMLEEQTQKRITIHHSYRLLQENYKLVMADNTELKSRIEMFQQELQEYKVMNGQYTLNSSRMMDGSRLIDGSAFWIPRLNLRDDGNERNHACESNQTTERLPEPERRERSLLDGIHTDRQMHRAVEPIKKPVKPKKIVIFRSKSTNILVQPAELQKPSKFDLFEHLRKWVVTGRLQRRKPKH